MTLVRVKYAGVGRRDRVLFVNEDGRLAARCSVEAWMSDVELTDKMPGVFFDAEI